MSNKTINLIKKFPFKNIRLKQKNVLEKLEKSFNEDNYSYYVCSLPTGFGKSPVAQAIGMSVDSAFLLTTTKQLQDQYIRDFGSSKVNELKGKANYKCNIEPGLNVECGPCTVNKDQLKTCKDNGLCSYYNQREKTLKSNIAVLSIPFFLYSTTCGRYWKPRDVIVIDECHLLEQQLVQWATMLISPKELKEEYDIETPEHIMVSGYKNNKKWLNDIWDIVLSKRVELEEEVKLMLDGKEPNSMSEDELEEITTSHSTYYKIDKLYKKLEIFFKSPHKKNWLCEPEEDGLLVTPIEVYDLFQRYIVSQANKKIVFMSATILDVVGFCKTFSIKREEVGIIKEESSFPPERSPIIYKPCGSMNFKNIDATIPKVIETVREILKNHPNEKAIIHSGNYKITEAIVNSINDKRLIMRQEGENNEKLMIRHANSKEPTVLVSPSLTTGSDLKDELSRFQIIVKMPFLSLADQRVKKKMELDSEWYACEMLRTLVQSTGRSTRSEEDWSVTYVLDNSFYFYIAKYRKWLSKEFIKRILWKESDFNLIDFIKRVEK